MRFTSVTHTAFYTDCRDVMIYFYTNTLGLKPKTYVTFKEYQSQPERREIYKIMQYTEDSYQVKGHNSE